MVEATLITTVYNEEDTLEGLLDSMKRQTVRPDEIIIVDGGSDDSTFEILQRYEEEMENLEVLQREGCNIAEGRNIAVRNSSNQYIVGTDGGCILDERWFEEMVDKFEEGAEYVIGMFRPVYDNLFEKVQGEIVCSAHTVEELKKGNRGPSSRSVGFSKKAWRAAGGYPEDLYTGEDSKFNSLVMAKGFEPEIAEEAVVYWRMRPDWSSFFMQFYRYGEGDARGGNLFTHPSQKLGVSKNFWLTLNSELTILALIAVIYSFVGLRSILPYSVGIFIGSSSVPTLYYLRTLVNRTLVEDGLKGFLVGVGISQVKSWAWYLGFAKEILKNPELVVKQFEELFDR
ncbi:MAG: glycosyltransferase [Candidatus Nanohaloarchaea archaeon]|nr:glycosyltransferase [Candidatus Nanohaloarchaea archaeon]